MDLSDQLLQKDNFIWAWHKVRRYYEATDGWYDEIEVAEFEAQLGSSLDSIRAQFAEGQYFMSAMTPLPQPKKRETSGKPQVRQAFRVKVADQVAWVAWVNVVGPFLERYMPTWSYGNRLYRTAWYEDPLNREHLHLGPFRNAPGLLYRPFRQSWAPYRRRIYLTVRAMASPRFKKQIPLDEPDRQVEEQERRLAREDWKLPYLKPGYWKKPAKAPCWASLDLERFYQSTNLRKVEENIRKYVPELVGIAGSVVADLLRFSLDVSGWPLESLEQMQLGPAQETYEHIPTGLMVAGFLANVALLDVDQRVSEDVERSQIAHFRYVDDHVVLAQNFEALVAWVDHYQQILAEQQIGAKFKDGKFQPIEFRDWRVDPGRYSRERAQAACTLDPRFPTPLMTKTLLKVSEIARTDFELLDEREERAALEDLEHLLLTDFPEAELPAPTRVSFAATRIARLASGRVGSVANLTALERQLVATTDHRLKHQLKNTIKTVRGKHRNDAIREGARVFNLLIEAVREYPEKLRLWVRALEFCRAVGHSNLDELVTYLLAQCKENETGSRVIRARILQTFAHQIVRCGQVIVALDEAPARREAAENYIRALPRYIARIKSSIKTPQPYEQMSIDLCSGACGIARVLLGGRFARSLAPANPIEWSSLPDGWPKGVWAWWSEMIIGTGATMQPGSIWRIVTPQLAANDAVSQAVLRRYPKLEGVPTISKNSLAEWSDWTSQRWRADAFDPRAGEWTAVCIALRLVEIAESRKTRVNAGSVFVPTEWAKSSETPSWHQWKSDFDAASKLDSLPSESGSGLSAIQNIAIILLGLLRRNLRWPADWNAPGPQYTSERVLRTMIGEARASSWTTAILEACLLPECRETIALFFSAPVVPMESDIARRALFIRRLKTLRKYLERAREVLANSQMTVHEDQPRQLIPIHIEQISREEWGIEEGNDFDPEVDDD